MSKPFHLSTSVFPETNATLSLGKDDLRWLEAFLSNLNVSVRATVPTPTSATDAATRQYVDDRLTVLTIEEADGSPSLTNQSTIRFDQADGFVVTNPSAGVARIDLTAIPYSVIQNVAATDRVLGRSTAGAGVIEEIVCTAAGRALLDDATAAAQRTTLGSTTVGDAVFITASAAAARTTLGSTTVGDAIFIAASAAGARSTLGSTTVGDAVFIAASAAAARTSIGAVIGTDVQAFDADLDAVAALAATAGMLSRTGAGAFAVRTITGTASNISVADGTGAAANPTIDLVNAGPGATGPIGSATVAPVVTIDAKGRVTALTSATITAGAITRQGGNTTEASTSSVSEVDLLTASGMSIASPRPHIIIVVSFNKAGSGGASSIGFKINATVVVNVKSIGAANGDHGGMMIVIPGGAQSLHTRGFVLFGSQGTTSITFFDAAAPEATFTDFIVRGINVSGADTLSADELHVYTLATS
jgi:hypothetical protein